LKRSIPISASELAYPENLPFGSGSGLSNGRTPARSHALPGGIHPAVGAAIIFLLAFLIYLPVLSGTFLMDDLRLVHTDNPLANGQLTPASIWFRTDFPIANLVFHWEWMMWGAHPAMYHAVNIMLHALGAVLLWRVLAFLKIPGAWLAAVLFTVHPVCVNSVARIAELKNTLSLPLFLAGALCYLQYEASALYLPAGSDPAMRRRGTVFYTASLVAFILALLTKTSTVMLPALLLVCACWQRGKVSRRDIIHLGPHFVVALSFGLMSVWFQKFQALAGQTLPPSSLLERLLTAPRVFWFYLGKAFLPLSLNLVYPRWKIDPHSAAAYLPLVFAAGIALACWKYRRSLGRPVLFALGSFAILLFPALGFFDAQYLTRWQVSDHLQYLPIIAPVSLIAAVILWAKNPGVHQTGAIALSLLFFGLGFQRAGVFSSQETLMRDTLEKNALASDAHNDLGVELSRRAQLPEALNEFTSAVHTDPENVTALSNLGGVMALQDRLPEARAQFVAALQKKPFDPETRIRLADICRRQGQLREACVHFEIALLFKPSADARLQLAGLRYQIGDFAASGREFRQVIQESPESTEALNNLSWLLATCADDRVRDGNEAVRCAERACQISGHKNSTYLSTLAAAYAEAGRFSDAATTAENALRLQTAAGENEMAEVNRQLLVLYRAGKPYHQLSPDSQVVSRL
jgi:tetratricopeptide (TPR) repeat protein